MICRCVCVRFDFAFVGYGLVYVYGYVPGYIRAVGYTPLFCYRLHRGYSSDSGYGSHLRLRLRLRCTRLRTHTRIPFAVTRVRLRTFAHIHVYVPRLPLQLYRLRFYAVYRYRVWLVTTHAYITHHTRLRLPDFATRLLPYTTVVRCAFWVCVYTRVVRTPHRAVTFAVTATVVTRLRLPDWFTFYLAIAFACGCVMQFPLHATVYGCGYGSVTTYTTGYGYTCLYTLRFGLLLHVWLVLHTVTVGCGCAVYHTRLPVVRLVTRLHTVLHVAGCTWLIGYIHTVTRSAHGYHTCLYLVWFPQFTVVPGWFTVYHTAHTRVGWITFLR